MVIQEPGAGPDEDPGSSGRQQRSRSRERTPPHVPSCADKESAAVEPQIRASNRSKLATKKRKSTETQAEVNKPSDLPKAKKHKPMDSDEDDEEPQNEL